MTARKDRFARWHHRVVKTRHQPLRRSKSVRASTFVYKLLLILAIGSLTISTVALLSGQVAKPLGPPPWQRWPGGLSIILEFLSGYFDFYIGFCLLLLAVYARQVSKGPTRGARTAIPQLARRRRNGISPAAQPVHKKNWPSRTREFDWIQVTSIVTTSTATLALLFTALSLQATHEQIDVNEQGMITDRYTKAIEQLGKPELGATEVRLGGIYALERIAQDSDRDFETVTSVLSAFVRNHAPRGSGSACPPDAHNRPSDVEAAITVLARMRAPIPSSGNADLHSTCLRGMRMPGADFLGVNLAGADLSDAKLQSAYLNNSRLSGANLSGANLWDIKVGPESHSERWRYNGEYTIISNISDWSKVNLQTRISRGPT